MSQFEQEANIKSHVKRGKTGAETVQMIWDVYQEECMSQSRICEWYLWFTVRRVLLADGKCKGRPLTTWSDDNITHVKDMLLLKR